MIVGTAGHVDHGKTALVKALTGVDTDRLPEEKRRGITLELGFAHLDLDGVRVGVIDVPGHERLVKTMSAGAASVDCLLLVIAADEGVMPQTREHLDICTLFGIQRGVIVVTKSDLLPGLGQGWLDLLKQDLKMLAAGTFLQSAPIVCVSSKTGEGLDLLKHALRLQLQQAVEKPASGPLLLPLDRVFVVKGFGTVVTGTLFSGSLSIDELVRLVPGPHEPIRARGLQVHGLDVSRAVAGQRVAVNLSSIEAKALCRGATLTRDGELISSRVLEVELHLLTSASKPLPQRSRQLVSLGTNSAEAQVQLLGVSQLKPGASALAQLRFDTETVALFGQRFVVRGSERLIGRGVTCAGGRVLHLGGRTRRKERHLRLQKLAVASPSEQVVWHLEEAGAAGLSEKALLARLLVGPKELSEILRQLTARDEVVLADAEAQLFWARSVLKALSQRAISLLHAAHTAHPNDGGLTRSELQEQLRIASMRAFTLLLKHLSDDGETQGDERIQLVGLNAASNSAAEQALKDQLESALKETGLAPLTLKELSIRFSKPEAEVAKGLNLLSKEHRILRAKDLYFHHAPVAEIEVRLRSYLMEHGEISTADFKTLVGQSRKYVIPLAEWFDAQRITLRIGDRRVLRKR